MLLEYRFLLIGIIKLLNNILQITSLNYKIYRDLYLKYLTIIKIVKCKFQIKIFIDDHYCYLYIESIKK